MNGAENQLLLRAEVMMPVESFVAHTRTLTSSKAFVETERALPIGTELTLRLSFPRMPTPVDVRGRVVRRVEPLGVGDAIGVEVEIALGTDRDRVAEFLARVNAKSAHPPASFRILLVEDNRLILDMFSYAFRKYFRGHQTSVEIATAADGNEAWQLLREAAFDLAIVDHYLPVLDGSLLVKRIRSSASLAGLTVVGISAGGTEVREAMLGAGVDIFLSKPIVMRDLLSTLERFVAQQEVRET
jgi:CheY-like chemotaxis protein